MKLTLTIEILLFQEDYVIFSLEDHSLHFSDFSGVLMEFFSDRHQFFILIVYNLLYIIQNMLQYHIWLIDVTHLPIFGL